MKNLGQMMKQAQEMQAKMAEMQQRLAETEVTGIAGGLFCLYLTIVDPSIFDFYYTEAMLIMVIVGGAGSFWPVIGAAIIFSMVPEILRMSNELRLVVYGGVLITAMLLMPEGFAGMLRRRRFARLRRALGAPQEQPR